MARSNALSGSVRIYSRQSIFSATCCAIESPPVPDSDTDLCGFAGRADEPPTPEGKENMAGARRAPQNRRFVKIAW